MFKGTIKGEIKIEKSVRDCERFVQGGKMIINLTKEEADYIEYSMYFFMESIEEMYEFMDDEQKKRESIRYQLSKDIIEKIHAAKKNITYEKKNENSFIASFLRGIANGPKETK